MNTPDKKPLAREADKFIIRLPEGMRDMIMEAAATNNRSMNAEIVARLLNSFDTKGTPPPIDVEKLSSWIAEKVVKKLQNK